MRITPWLIIGTLCHFTEKTTKNCRVLPLKRSMRNQFRLKKFYQKSTIAWDLPIVSSAAVSDEALIRACQIVHFMLADRPEVRQRLYDFKKKFGVLGENERITSTPEYKKLYKLVSRPVRGIGGTVDRPLTIGPEENLLCTSRDAFHEDIYIHETAHGIHLVGGAAVPGLMDAALEAYERAIDASLWRHTYASVNLMEYFAEGVQSFFNAEGLGIEDSGPEGGDHHVNDISTRQKLADYDFQLYYLISRLFPCGNWGPKRCEPITKKFTYKIDCVVTPNKLEIALRPNETPTVFQLDANIWSQETCDKLKCGLNSTNYNTVLVNCLKDCLIKIGEDY